MLDIFNILRPFFEDCYRRINVREYARLQKISPPTASSILKKLHKQGLLKKEDEKIYNYYFANKESELFIDLSRIYWKMVLEQSGLIKEIENKLLNPVIYLFGSLSKGEAKKDSDIDLAVFSISKKTIMVGDFEKKLSRKIQIFIYKDFSEIENNQLKNNILNGLKIYGEW
jgi:predicted nucleotidyltransferase